MSGAVSLPTIPLYLSIEKNESKAIAATEAGDTATQNLIAHFNNAASTLATPAALLGDYRSLQVVLGAFGMSGMIGETAVLQKLMTQNPASPTSLSATANNPLWTSFAKQMSGWTDGSTPLSSSTNVATIVSNFTTAQFETKEGSSEPGLQQALYFTRQASTATSIDALMSDPTLLNVAETVNGLDPTQFGSLDFDQQKAIMTSDVKLSSFASASSIQRYAEQYLAMTAADPPSTAPSYSVTSLFDDTDDTSLLGVIAGSLGLTV